MIKIVSLFSFLFFLTLGVSHAWALPDCVGSWSITNWTNCIGTYTWENGDKYVGEHKDGESHGQGTFTWGNGDKYVGKYQDGKRHGQGTITWADGAKYVGEWKDGKKHGQGTYTYAEGDKYVGKYQDGKRHGEGTYTYSSGNKYVGRWKNGNYHGQGTFTFADGSKDVGEWENNKLNGYAIQYNADGSIRREGIFKDYEFLYAETREKKDPSSQMSSLSPCPSDQNATYDMCFGTYDWTSGDNKGDKYIGEWKKDIMHGQGMYIFANGDKYQGAWKDGKKHGPGIFLYLADNEFKGDIYVGEYKFDLYNGQGTYIWKDGSKYTGNWLDNNQDGQGIYIYPDGSKEVGEFKNGLLNGFAIRYNADGSITQEGIFKDDEFLHAKTSEKKEPSKLDKYKSTCEELGFTPGTEKFGDCVIKLMDKDLE